MMKAKKRETHKEVYLLRNRLRKREKEIQKLKEFMLQAAMEIRAIRVTLDYYRRQGRLFDQEKLNNYNYSDGC